MGKKLWSHVAAYLTVPFVRGGASGMGERDWANPEGADEPTITHRRRRGLVNKRQRPSWSGILARVLRHDSRDIRLCANQKGSGVLMLLPFLYSQKSDMIVFRWKVHRVSVIL